MRSIVERQLSAKVEAALVRELLDAHAEVKRNFYLGGLRLSAVEGGRFCEAAFRILEHQTSGGVFTPLGSTLPRTDRLIADLGQLSSTQFNDSIRLHIPRSLRLVYDIRNKRDAAHLADGIDPNLQDATLVVGIVDWVLAEFIRIFHNIAPDQASKLVDTIVKRSAPIVQDFDGYLKVLNPMLKASEHCLVLLYQRGDSGASLEEISSWVRPLMRKNLARTLRQLVDKQDYLHFDGSLYFITRRGELEVEKRGLISESK